MQDRDFAINLPWSPPRNEAKLTIGMGWGGGKVQKKVSVVEETIYFKRGEIDPD